MKAQKPQLPGATPPTAQRSQVDTQTGWGQAGQELQESRGVCVPSSGPCPVGRQTDRSSVSHGRAAGKRQWRENRKAGKQRNCCSEGHLPGTAHGTGLTSSPGAPALSRPRDLPRTPAHGRASTTLPDALLWPQLTVCGGICFATSGQSGAPTSEVWPTGKPPRGLSSLPLVSVYFWPCWSPLCMQASAGGVPFANRRSTLGRTRLVNARSSGRCCPSSQHARPHSGRAGGPESPPRIITSQPALP